MAEVSDLHRGPGEVHDLGHGLSLCYYHDGSSSGVWEAFDAGLDCGMTLWRGDDLIGQVPFLRAGGGAVWGVVSRDPLTLSPSILCQPANLHGHIRDGRWFPC